jgi:hypothetical protein
MMSNSPRPPSAPFDKAAVEKRFIEEWGILRRMRRHDGRTGVCNLLASQQRTVERLIGQLVQYGGHSAESLANLTRGNLDEKQDVQAAAPPREEAEA